VEFQTEAGDRFTARLSHLDGKKLDRFDLDSEAKARAAADAILAASGFNVASVEHREVRRNPFPPFTTSTLQQEASRKLGFGPTDMARQPGDVARHLDNDMRRLYELVWKRTIASQMASALLDQVSIDIADPSGRVGLHATGSVMLFDGFLKLYQEDRDDDPKS